MKRFYGMKIRTVESFPFRAERNLSPGTGTAGSPAPLQAGSSNYRWAETYPVLYSTQFETALVRITLENGVAGWGEAQAPLAPEVACTIIDRILKPVLEGLEFDGTQARIAELWWTMYSTMRVRGQTGGFMMDAIAGIDIALWDLAGKLTGTSVAALLGSSAPSVRSYLSGLPGGNPDHISEWLDQGIDTVKVFYQSSDEKKLWGHCDRVRELMGNAGNIAVDALWRLTPGGAIAWSRELTDRKILFLEAPLAPESAVQHGALAQELRTPIAIGESYRSTFELEPFFAQDAMRVVQPDLGRTGITEALRIAGVAKARGVDVIPHVSIAMGPQIAAAIHFAAAVQCPLLEFNPNVLTMANRFLAEPIVVKDGRYMVSGGPGLGVELRGL